MKIRKKQNNNFYLRCACRVADCHKCGCTTVVQTSWLVILFLVLLRQAAIKRKVIAQLSHSGLAAFAGKNVSASSDVSHTNALRVLQQPGSVFVDLLFIVTPIVGVCNCSMFCCTLLYVHASLQSS